MRITAFILFVFLTAGLSGQSSVDSVVNKECLQYMHGYGPIGLSVGVIVRSHKHVYNFGVSELGSLKPPTDNSIYSIGSISKTFIAMLLAKAVKEKHIDLLDDIRKYLPDSMNFGNLHYGTYPVRLIHLCNHTSRIPSQLAELPVNWNSLTPFEKYDFKKSYTKIRFLQDLTKVKPDTIPGYKYEYSNASYKVLSIILEKIYQTPFDDLIKKYFAEDLNMKATKVFLDKADWQLFASGLQDKKVLMDIKGIDDFTSGPGLYSTVNDMLKYLSYNISGKDKAIKLTHSTTFSNSGNVEIGLAWRIAYSPEGEKYFYHSGSGTGCNSFCLFSPTKKLGIIVMANETSDQKRLIDAGMKIMSGLTGLEAY
jgi:serine-type D-Ala-D-Ala carboxypeptidase/endopeptidase